MTMKCSEFYITQSLFYQYNTALLDISCEKGLLYASEAHIYYVYIMFLLSFATIHFMLKILS